MKVIEQEMIAAITARREWHKSNTSTHVNEREGYMIVRLHGNMIAVIYPDRNRIELRDGGGYRTVTTKNRLNAIAGHFGLPPIYQKAKVWYIGDQVWTGCHVLTLDDSAPVPRTNILW